MRDTARKLLTYIEQSGITKDDILSSETIQWTITTPLYNIGEQAYNLSSEYKEAHPDIPWAKISGLRHRLVHNYYDTSWELIASVVYNGCPVFIKTSAASERISKPLIPFLLLTFGVRRRKQTV